MVEVEYTEAGRRCVLSLIGSRTGKRKVRGVAPSAWAIIGLGNE
jgi:hypothetical protein